MKIIGVFKLYSAEKSLFRKASLPTSLATSGVESKRAKHKGVRELLMIALFCCR